ncbi:hypothetical protein Bca52824_066833 [Brassica carinata]|uniref:Uncharacterized protein n=1 Tax=Brassica carinata TaxID=52824 RepID=A0A8X7QM91_BRACI|nr:hypothetical protein Bca52824_066833 [Brassica carinata]
MIWGRGVFIGDTSQSASGWWQPWVNHASGRILWRHLVLHMSAACPGHMQGATTSPTCQDACLECMQEATSVHTCRSACIGCIADTPRAWSIHLMLPHVGLHVLLPCGDTSRFC